MPKTNLVHAGPERLFKWYLRTGSIISGLSRKIFLFHLRTIEFASYFTLDLIPNGADPMVEWLVVFLRTTL